MREERLESSQLDKPLDNWSLQITPVGLFGHDYLSDLGFASSQPDKLLLSV